MHPLRATGTPAAAAPTDGETQGANLRSTRFTYMCGEKDTAYGRIERCRRCQKLIEELKGGRDDIYPVAPASTRPATATASFDRDKIPTIYDAVRNAAPREVTWVMTDGLLKDYFCCTCPSENFDEQPMVRSARTTS